MTAPRKACPCAIELAGKVAIGSRQTCDDCGQVWACEPADRAACRWVRVDKDAPPKLTVVKGGKA